MTSPNAHPYSYVDTTPEVNRLAETIAAVDRVAMDLEGDSLYHYFEKVCLIQVTVGDACAIVDPLAGADLTQFVAALADTPMVLHATDYDLRMLRGSFGFRPGRPVFDTMLAAQLLGHEQLGLAALVERYFGVVLPKKGKKSDWSHRPLSAAQLDYARDDTRYLLSLADRLAEELDGLGRLGWHRESCEAAVEATAADAERDPADAWRIKGLRGLDDRQLAFVREIWHWRDREARQADLPPFRILGNRQLIELALWAAAHPGRSLADGPRLPRPTRGRRLDALYQAIRRAQRLPDDQWPQRRKGTRRPTAEPGTRDRIVALRSACAALAVDLALDPAVLAPRAALAAVAAQKARTVDAVMTAGPLLRWQAELVLKALDDVE